MGKRYKILYYCNSRLYIYLLRSTLTRNRPTGHHNRYSICKILSTFNSWHPTNVTILLSTVINRKPLYV